MTSEPVCPECGRPFADCPNTAALDLDDKRDTVDDVLNRYGWRIIDGPRGGRAAPQDSSNSQRI